MSRKNRVQKEKSIPSSSEPIKLRNAIYPIIIGALVVVYMLWNDFNPDVFNGVHFTWQSVCWLLLAVLCMFGRDIGYIIRIKLLSEGRLSLAQAFRVIMLWEFTSAVTPSAVGGTSVALLYIHKEGIPIGRSTAIVMLTSFLDEIYFIVMFPLMMAIVGYDQLFNIVESGSMAAKGLITFAITGYLLKLAYVIFLSYGLLVNPRGLKWLLMKVFRLKWLRRWHHNINEIGDDIIASSIDIKRRSKLFWSKVLAATFLSWSSRYLVANMLILAFFSVSDHVLLFARQLVMWIMMLVMPTPGGSGFAEYIFKDYCADLISVPVEMQAGAAVLIALLWRFVTYYPYIITGIIILPKWLKRSFSNN